MLASLALIPFTSTAVIEASWLLIFPVQAVSRRWLRTHPDGLPAA